MPIITHKAHPSECAQVYESQHIIHTTSLCPRYSRKADARLRRGGEATIMLRNHDAQACPECTSESGLVWVRLDNCEQQAVFCEPYAAGAEQVTLAQLKSAAQSGWTVGI